MPGSVHDTRLEPASGHAARAVVIPSLLPARFVHQGPYRFSFSTYCRELQSPVLTLLLPVPNARNHVGENRDTFLPNPDATRPVEVQMLEFMGALVREAWVPRETECVTVLAPWCVYKRPHRIGG